MRPVLIVRRDRVEQCGRHVGAAGAGQPFAHGQHEVGAQRGAAEEDADEAVVLAVRAGALLRREHTELGEGTPDAGVQCGTSTGKTVKSAAASALTQSKAPNETTSEKAAKASSKVLRDGRTSKAAKSAAGSALTLARGKKK